MASITNDLKVCGCCAQWLANADDSSCRHYHEHTSGFTLADHREGLCHELPAGAALGDELDASRYDFRCDGCGSIQLAYAEAWSVVVFA